MIKRALPARRFAVSSKDDSSLRRKFDPLKGRVEDFLKNISVYEEWLDDSLDNYFLSKDTIKGHATSEGTERYIDRS